jgi:hypothetical protein
MTSNSRPLQRNNSNYREMDKINYQLDIMWQMTNLDDFKQQTTAAVITVTIEMVQINYQLDIMLRKKCIWKFTDRNFLNSTSFL